MKALAFGLALALCASASVGHAATWAPEQWVSEDTVELRTTSPGEDPHWFPVWLVVLDGQVYLRLGSRAAERIAVNQTAPYVGVRIAGQEFDRVEGRAAPEAASAVAAAMGEKYLSDVLIKYFPHPLTLQLVPPTAGAASPPAAVGAAPE